MIVVVVMMMMDLVVRTSTEVFPLKMDWMVVGFVVFSADNIRWMDQNRHKNHHTHPEVVARMIATMLLPRRRMLMTVMAVSAFPVVSRGMVVAS
jgi:hypothetical protein